MPDYKELYLTMMRETEKAIRILVEAQKNCEERYLQSEEMEKLPGDIAAQWNQTIRLLYEGIYHDGMGGHETLFRTTDGEITLSEGADRLYEEYFNTLQDKKDRAGNDYEAAIYSKFQIQVLRYAGIVHALEVAEEKGQRNDYYYHSGYR